MRIHACLRIFTLALTFALYLPLLYACNTNANEPATKDPEPGTDTPTAAPETTQAPETTETVEKPHWNDDGELKILCVGNSFSIDSLEYLYGVLRDLGIEKIKLGNLYVSGCSLQTHLVNAKTDNTAYLYYTNIDGTWSGTDGYKMSDAIASENWDFISFQQASHESGVASSYVHLPKLMDIVEEICPTAHFVWHMTGPISRIPPTPISPSTTAIR